MKDIENLAEFLQKRGITIKDVIISTDYVGSATQNQPEGKFK